MSKKRQHLTDFEAGEQGTNPYLKAAILEVVENQLREHNPPETQQTRHSPTDGGVHLAGNNRTDWFCGGGRNPAGVARAETI